MSSGSVDVNGDGVINDREWMNDGSYTGPKWQFTKAELTYNMEVGVDWNFVSDYTLTATTYYKSASDQQVRYPASSRIYNPITKSASGYGGSPPDGFEDSRGIEFAIRKAFSNYFAFNVSYNANWRTGASTNRSTRIVIPSPEWIQAGKWWNSWEAAPDGSGAWVPVNPSSADITAWSTNSQEEIDRLDADVDYERSGDSLPDGLVSFKEVSGADENGPGGAQIVQSTYPGIANGDRRHNATATVTFATPDAFGPAARGFHVLGGLRANLVYRFLSGIPYPYVTAEGEETRYSTIQTYTDLGVVKTFGRSEGVHADLFLEISNLFNQANYQLLTSSAHPPPVEWDKWGWPTSTPPDDEELRKFGEMDTRFLYAGQPRFVEFGVRIFW
jgi:hypothetical protein